MIQKFWLHNKTSETYELLGFTIEERSGVIQVRYKNINDSIEWVRPAHEFFDGRFIPTETVRTRSDYGSLTPQPYNPKVTDYIGTRTT